MINLFYGEEDYLIAQEIGEIKSKLSPDLLSLNFVELDGKKLKFADLRSHVLTVPFLGTGRIVLVRDYLKYFKEEKGLDNFAQLLDEVPASTDLIFVEEKLDKRKKVTKTLLAKAFAREFGKMDPRQAAVWAIKRAEQKGGRINTRAAHQLVSLAGTNLWLLENELGKLINYKDGNLIEADDVVLLCFPIYQEDVFRMIDAIVEKKTGLALMIMHTNIKSGLHPLYLLKLIAGQFRRVLYIRARMERGGAKPDDLTKGLGVHPFVARKTFSQARKYKLGQLIEIYKSIAQMDLNIKKGQIDADLALDMFAMELA